MGLPLAKQGDQIIGTCTHIVMIPSAGGPIPIPLPHPFVGIIDSNLSTNVKVGGRPAATVGSIANNTPPHIPTPPGTSFSVPPSNQANITMGSATVRINGKFAARMGDQAQTCSEFPVPATVVAAGNVMVGG